MARSGASDSRRLSDDAEFKLSDDVTAADRAAVVDGLTAFNSQYGFPWPWRDLNFVVRDTAGGVVGGILAETNAQWCYVKGLWVAESHRRRGLGRRLLAAAESAARDRGCIGIYLDTYSFQARPFYERLGYTVFGVLPDMPPGGTKYYLSKRTD